METRLRQGAPVLSQHCPEVTGGEQVKKPKEQKVMWVVEDGLLQLDGTYQMSSSPKPQASGGK